METKLHSIKVISNGRIRINDKPEGIFGFVRHDADSLVYGVSRPTHNGSAVRFVSLPETIPAITTEGYVSLTEELEWYWFNIFKSYAPPYMTLDRLKTVWLNYMAGDRFITNRAGSDTNRSFVGGTNQDSEPMRAQSLVTGGAIVRLTTDVPFWKYGTWVYEAYCINAKKPLPNLERQTHGRNGLVYNATLSYRDWYNSNTNTWLREDRVTQFWQLDGNDVPSLFLANEGTVILPASRIRILSEDELIPSSYVP